MKTKTLLILGSEGFLGSNVKTLIQKENAYKILEVKNSSDLNLMNYEDLVTKFKDTKIDYIINCAAFVGGVSYGYEYQAKLLEENTQLAINICKFANEKRVENLVNPISNCVYPENVTEYKEKDLFNGRPHESVMYYAYSKRFLINLCESYFKQFELNSTNVIMSNMFGPNDHFEENRSHALGALVKKICDAKLNKNTSIEVWGDGTQIREWLYVEDGAKALINSLHLKGFNFYNVGVNKGISINELVEEIQKSVNYQLSIDYNLSKPTGVSKKTLNGSLGSRIIKWDPEWTLTKGISETTKWYLENN